MARARRRNKRALAATALLLLGLLAAALPAAADPKDELSRIRDKKERIAAKRAAKAERAQELSTLVGRLDAKRAAVESDVQALEDDLKRLDGRIAVVADDLTAAQVKVTGLTEDLQDVLGNLEVSTDLFAARAVALYKAGPTAYLDGIFTAETFNDLVDQQAYQRSALDSDAELVGSIELLRDQTNTKRLEIVAKQEEIAAAKRRLEDDRRDLAALKNERTQVLAKRQAIVDEKASVLADIRSDERRLAAVEAQLKLDEARYESILHGQGSSSSGIFPTGGGQLAWPAAGPITSTFGYRTHPIFGDRRFHAGVDIGAPYGAPVVAAEDGVVIFAGVMSGYGNAIIVDHGNGLATTYNHLSAFSVGSGQEVSRSTQVGSIGCSGYCTGPHLHFEVRINGSPVDPLPFLQ